MAEIAEVSMNGSKEVEEEKWAKHYSSKHEILLVGEGDFSFSLSLAVSFGSASNIVASSLDSYDVVIKKYKRAKTNLQRLGSLGAEVLYGVDAIKMKIHTDLRKRKFDRIVYNFPHAGFLGKEEDRLVIMMHRNLVRGFFKNASGMLRPNGEVHVTHKTNCPFYCWNIEQLASQSCLSLRERVKFKLKDYPGYNNKRGDGNKPDNPFPLGKCSTFKFISSLTAKKPATSDRTSPQRHQEIPVQTARMAMHPAPVKTGNECFRIFREYFNHACLKLADERLSCYAQDVVKIGFERYKAENPDKPLDGYIHLLEELRNLSKQRVAFLRNWLLELYQQHGL